MYVISSGKRMRIFFFLLVTEFICYYGKQTFDFLQSQQIQIFDKLLTNNIKSNSPINSNSSIPDSNLLPLETNKNTFFQKYKKYIITIGIILLIMIIITIILIIIRSQNQSSNIDNVNRRISDDSNIE